MKRIGGGLKEHEVHSVGMTPSVRAPFHISVAGRAQILTGRVEVLRKQHQQS